MAVPSLICCGDGCYTRREICIIRSDGEPIRLLVRMDRIRTTAPQSTTTELKSLTEFHVFTFLGAQDVKNRLNVYLLQHKLNLTQEPPAATVATLSAQMRAKDAPILAAAMHSPAHYLATLDYRDLLRPEVRSLAPTLMILSPGDLVRGFVSA